MICVHLHQLCLKALVDGRFVGLAGGGHGAPEVFVGICILGEIDDVAETGIGRAVARSYGQRGYDALIILAPTLTRRWRGTRRRTVSRGCEGVHPDSPVCPALSP